MSKDPLLRVINLSKKFGSLHAIRQVSFDVHAGEVVGLTGSIASGKSALTMLLAGLYEPTEGDLYFDNQRLHWPFKASKLGIGVIHQKPELVNRLDITSNVFLGNEIGWPGSNWWKIPNRRKMEQETERVLAQLDLQVDNLRQRVSNLTSEQRQLLAVARVLTHPVKLVIIDEPTVLLSYPYQQRLLGLIQNWRQKGVAIIFSSNNLDHLFAVSDRIITLRNGRKVNEFNTDQTTRDEVVASLLGYDEANDVTQAIWTIESYYRTREQAERLRYYQMLLEKDLAAQDTLNQQLIEQLTEQLNTLDASNQALQDAQRRLLTEREEERKHLARELHDQVIQDLLSVNYKLEELEAENEDGEGDDLSRIRHEIRDLVGAIRIICGNLRPPTIDSLGLGPAVQSYAQEWSMRTGIEVSLQLDENLRRLPELTELSIFRIVQEALSNVRKHANASSVEIRMQHTTPRSLMVSISDDGQGLPDELDIDNLAPGKHYGLVGISERVALMGGRLRLQAQPKRGTIVQVEISHPRVDAVVPSLE
jgi:signal transduction histidine kinase